MHERPQPAGKRRRPASGTILAIFMIIAILIVGGLSAWSRLTHDDDMGMSVQRSIVVWSHDGGGGQG